MIENYDENPLTRAELSVAVALAKGSGRRVYDSETRRVYQNLIAGGWTRTSVEPDAANPPGLGLCSACNVDLDFVCDACQQHACFCGQLMCEDARTAGVKRAVQH
jgi:hypothetical protein